MNNLSLWSLVVLVSVCVIIHESRIQELENDIERVRSIYKDQIGVEEKAETA